MKVLGLTGSIGMGKTTAAQMFAAKGAAIWNADDTVHRLYAKGGAAVDAVAEAFPTAVTAGGVDRDALKRVLVADPGNLTKLEQIVHPLVQADRTQFIEEATAPLLVLDIPLLFETGADAQCDRTAVVSTDAQTQRARVMARGTMTEDTFAAILKRQMPDADKRARADYIIRSDSFDTAQADIDHIWQEMVKET